jgi:hypothetical protein
MSTGLPEAYYTTHFILAVERTALPKGFAIVTAFNPMDHRYPPEENRAKDQALKGLLDHRMIESIRATGGSPDMSHAEPGWAISTSISTAVEIAREFHQRALWWIEDDELHLVDCASPEPIRIANFSDRILSS